MKAQKADVLTQFSEMKKNEGLMQERKRIAEKLYKDGWCVISNNKGCMFKDNYCVSCWDKYLEKE